jgi:DNA-directed RNA polymerase
MAHAVEPVEKAITAWVEEQKSKRGVKHCALKWVDLLGHDVAAYFAVQCIIDNIGFGSVRSHALHEIANAIAAKIIDELRYRRFAELAPALFKYRMARFTTSSYAHMARSLDAALRIAVCDACRTKGKTECKHLDDGDLFISRSHRVLLGTKLIDLTIQATGLVELRNSQRIVGHGKSRKVRNRLDLAPAEGTLEWLLKRNGVLEDLEPVSLPMVVPPLRWALGTTGGYRFAMRHRHTLVRTSHWRSAPAQTQPMPPVYTALNALQNTPWRINSRVLGVIEQIVATGGGVAGVPTLALAQEPAKPDDIDTNEDARRAWRLATRHVKDHNVEIARDAIAFYKALDVARRFKDDEAIFFPYNLDFRGRIYPISNFLTPQGDDLSKGLLTFAQGKPLGEDGAGWLAVHGCNALGKTTDGQKVSKMTLQERADWINAHSVEIVQVAGDPFANRWWLQAEEPIQFLAFCFEWAGFQREGSGYVCSLPVAQDGSCNGLQHFSAMLRDEVGGYAVNLLPLDRPQDVYDQVAQRVLAMLEEIAHEDDAAALWLSSGLVSRSLVKRPTMTFSYGSKPYGFQTQLYEYLKTSLGNTVEESKAKWQWAQEHFSAEAEDGTSKDMVSTACGLMSRMIWESLREIVRAAFGGMEWLQKCAREVVKNGKTIEWVVPSTGFRVRQQYFVDSRKQVETMIAGKLVKPSVYTETEEVQSYKQVNAIAPNVVHSLDAAALMLTVVQAQAEGIEHFATVHDSYGTLAADMTLLARVTRQSFVQLYTSNDVVADLARQFQEQAPDASKIPEPPVAGKLDLGLVLASDYFFC